MQNLPQQNFVLNAHTEFGVLCIASAVRLPTDAETGQLCLEYEAELRERALPGSPVLVNLDKWLAQRGC